MQYLLCYFLLIIFYYYYLKGIFHVKIKVFFLAFTHPHVILTQYHFLLSVINYYILDSVFLLILLVSGDL